MGDLVGSCSLLLDIKFIGIFEESTAAVTGVAAGEYKVNIDDNVIVVRSARIAKMAARAGRITRFLKLFRFLPGGGDLQIEEDHGFARNISNRMIKSLVMRVPLIIITTVLVLPAMNMFVYPSRDLSPDAFL